MDKPLSKMTVEELRVERDTLWDKINAVLAGAVAGDEGATKPQSYVSGR